MYFVLCEFYADTKTWRIRACEPVTERVAIGSVVVRGLRLLKIPSEKRLVVGAWVNPRKILGIPKRPDIKERMMFRTSTNSAGACEVLLAPEGLKKLSLKALYAVHAVLEREIASRSVDEPFFVWLRNLEQKGVLGLVSNHWKTRHLIDRIEEGPHHDNV